MKKVLMIGVYEATGSDGRNYFPSQVSLNLDADTADAVGRECKVAGKAG